MTIPHNILVPVIQSPASLEAVTIAALLARQKKGRVYVAHVIEVSRSLPLNAELEAEARRGEQIVRQAEEAAASAGYPVTGTILQAREAGPALVDEATDNAIDAIIIGTTDSIPGKVVEYILTHATCAVWVVRQSKIPKEDHHHE